MSELAHTFKNSDNVLNHQMDRALETIGLLNLFPFRFPTLVLK